MRIIRYIAKIKRLEKVGKDLLIGTERLAEQLADLKTKGDEYWAKNEPKN